MNTADINGSLLLDPTYYRDAMASCRAEADLSSVLFPVRHSAPNRALLADAVAVVNISGAIYGSGWGSYEWIARDFDDACNNDQVKGIVFMIDSPGGVVSGCFDLVDHIYNHRSDKPTIAIVNELAASGSYAIASACERIIMPRTARVGSVGVIRTHWDLSKALEKWGEAVTMIYAGSHKNDFNPFEPLPKSVRAEAQTDVEKTYSLFTSTVARNRGIDEQQVIDTQAQIYTGEDALKHGLATEINSVRDALEQFVKQVISPTGDAIMKIKSADLTEKLKAAGMKDEAITALGFPAGGEVDVEEESVSTTTVQKPTPVTQPGEESVSASEVQDRISSILSSEHATGREKIAQHYALKTTMSAESAIAALKLTPATDPLSEAMYNSGSPDVSSGEGGDSGDQSVSEGWASAFKSVGAKLRD